MKLDIEEFLSFKKKYIKRISSVNKILAINCKPRWLIKKFKLSRWLFEKKKKGKWFTFFKILFIWKILYK